MRVLVCPDKFKGSLTATEVIRAVTAGILRARPNAHVSAQALADGGEGSLSIVRQAFAVQEHRLRITGPLRRSIDAAYLLGDGQAYVESAAACGLHHVPPARRDPGYTTSIGLGQLIEDALARGATTVNVFLGGSATNDGGAGMAAALGYRFLSDRGNDFVPSGNSLAYVRRIDRSAVLPALEGVTVRAICDVRNPLLGPGGATHTYARQKGATPEQLPDLERHMAHYAGMIRQDLGQFVAEVPGSGAAGGLGAGCLAFLNAELVSGIDWLMNAVRLDRMLAGTDLVITGEGKIDGQTLSGKVVAGVGRMAANYGVPVWAVAGRNDLPAGTLPEGIARILALTDLEGVSTERAMREASSLLTDLVADSLVDPE